MITAILPERGCDPHGCGHFGAPRGNKKHKGVDFWAPPGAVILAKAAGKVERTGFCYAKGPGSVDDKDPFQLVVIRHRPKRFARYLYLEPLVSAGELVQPGQPIGVVQDLTRRLKKIRTHVHIDMHEGANHRTSKVVHPDDWF